MNRRNFQRFLHIKSNSIVPLDEGEGEGERVVEGGREGEGERVVEGGREGEKEQEKKIYFLTFGGQFITNPKFNSRNYVNYFKAVERICREAKEFSIFNDMIGLTESYLKEDNTFWNIHKEFIMNNERGYGLWIWKPYIIKKQLEKITENDILVYADSGCILNINGKDRMNEYIEMSKKSKSGIVCFQLSQIECEWTKMDVFNYLNANDLLETKQIISGIFIIRKSDKSVEIINKWYDICCNYNLIDDSQSISINHEFFKENRHDQSIISLLIKQNNNSIILDDETYFKDWETDGKLFPIWAKRKRHE